MTIPTGVHQPAAPPGEVLPDTLPVRVRGRASAEAEFSSFMAAHTRALARTAWLLTGDVHQAEELTQLALMRTYLAWGRARQGDPLAFARRTLTNARIDTWRRRRRKVLTAPGEMPQAASGDSASAIADRDRLVRALAMLTRRQRRIVVLRHLEDLPEQEVAAMLGVSVGTVKATTSRALARLRAELTSEEQRVVDPRKETTR